MGDRLKDSEYVHILLLPPNVQRKIFREFLPIYYVVTFNTALTNTENRDHFLKTIGYWRADISLRMNLGSKLLKLKNCNYVDGIELMLKRGDTIRQEARKRWLLPLEIRDVLSSYALCGFPLSIKPPFEIENGDLYIFSRELTPTFKEDGVDWVRKKTGATREDFVKVLIDGYHAITALSTYSVSDPNFRRRSYRFPINSTIYLVHYRQCRPRGNQYGESSMYTIDNNITAQPFLKKVPTASSSSQLLTYPPNQSNQRYNIADHIHQFQNSFRTQQHYQADNSNIQISCNNKNNDNNIDQKYNNIHNCDNNYSQNHHRSLHMKQDVSEFEDENISHTSNPENDHDEPRSCRASTQSITSSSSLSCGYGDINNRQISDITFIPPPVIVDFCPSIDYNGGGCSVLLCLWPTLPEINLNSTAVQIIFGWKVVDTMIVSPSCVRATSPCLPPGKYALYLRVQNRIDSVLNVTTTPSTRSFEYYDVKQQTTSGGTPTQSLSRQTVLSQTPVFPIQHLSAPL